MRAPAAIRVSLSCKAEAPGGAVCAALEPLIYPKARAGVAENSASAPGQKRCRTSAVVRPFGSVITAVSGPLKLMVSGAKVSLVRVAVR